jgi:hypothetical protein
MTSSGMITAPDDVVPASEGGGELPTTFELLAGEVAPADEAGAAAPRAPPGAEADPADGADAPDALPPDPGELLKPAIADESEPPPPPPHALTPRTAPLTMEANRTLLRFIIIYMLRKRWKSPRKSRGVRCFQIKRFFREYRHLHAMTISKAIKPIAQFFIQIIIPSFLFL